MILNFIERVAKAICPDDFNRLPGHRQGECSYCDDQRDMVRKQARAAIEALKQSIDVDKYDERLMNCFRCASVQEWNAAIDYCIKDDPTQINTPDPYVP